MTSRIPCPIPLQWSRRTVLAAGTASLWPMLSPWAGAAHVSRAVKLRSNPFMIGVASGDPNPTSVVLWTRLTQDPLQPDAMPPEAIVVGWELANDEQFHEIVQQGEVIATPETGHAVHVTTQGLQPERWYFYRFHAAGYTSPIGRTRTAPQATQMAKSLRFAFASCQHYESGYYTAYQHMIREPLDLIVHLGDYIYEDGGKKDKIRMHAGGEIVTLNHYRVRHSQYKSDPDLQAAHQLCPWIVTWDDHEFDNNYANDIPDDKAAHKENFLERRAAAYQAYYENMPLRRSAMPKGPAMELYRNVGFGQLAQFAVLDTRQYRTDQPNGDGSKPQTGEALSPRGTILGKEQQAWLERSLSESKARWNVLAQQVMMARVDRKAGEETAFSMDQWPGYEVNRQEVLRFLGDRKISNPVVITGDIHSNWANNLSLADEGNGTPVAVEFVGTSISSGGNGNPNAKAAARIQSENGFVKFHDAHRGYVSCEVTPETWVSRYQEVEYVEKPGAPLVTRATFIVEAGRPGLEKA